MTPKAKDAAIDASAIEADAIADLVNRMSVGNPEAFAIQRDLIAKRLRRLARQIRGDVSTKAVHTWRNPVAR